MTNNMQIMFMSSDRYGDEGTKRHLESCGQKCRFGYSWWYWVPRIKISLIERYKCVEIIWLRFSLSYEGTIE